MSRLTACLLACSALLASLPSPAVGQAQRSLELSLDSLLSTPVSSASKYEQRQTDAPAFVTIVTAEEIRRQGYRTLDEVLTMQVGFYVGNDRQHTDVGFRGFGRPANFNNKLLLLVDGHSLNDNYTGGTRLGSAMAIDLETVQRIEIVRGPGSSVYGARAMLAVVNLITRKGRDLDGFEAVGTLGTLGTRGASVGYGKVWGPDTDLAVSMSWGDVDGENLYFKEYDSPAQNYGRSIGLDWDRWARSMATFRSGGLSLQTAVGSRTKGIPTAAYQATFNHPDIQSRDRTMFAEARYERAVGSTAELTLRSYYDFNDNVGRFPYGDVGSPATEATTIGTVVQARSVGGEGRLRWDPSPRQRVVAGLETTRVYHALEELTGTAPVPADYSMLSAFAQSELQFTPDLSLTLGLRRDQYSGLGSATTPRGALVFHPYPNTTFKALAGEAFRAPNLLETHPSLQNIGFVANPELSPERIRTLELVWDQRFPGVATTVSVFHNRMRGLIELEEIVPPDSLSDFGPLAVQYQNITNARSVGVDAHARVELPMGISAQIGYSHHQARDDATGAMLVNSPRHQLRVSTSKELGGAGHLGVNLRAESGRKTLYGTQTSGSALVDVSATTWSLPAGLTLHAVVKNLFDTRWATPAGVHHVQESLPQPGRLLTVRLGWSNQ